MTVPTPEASTPKGRFLTAYGSWQHARVPAGLAVLAAPQAQVLTLAANLAHWTIELDQAWERLEGESYAQARDAHPARIKARGDRPSSALGPDPPVAPLP